ncbi:MAG TPA: TonB-dependent receptor [Pyrinomonadaceae bacterium]|jgi:hypothetical protein
MKLRRKLPVAVQIFLFVLSSVIVISAQGTNLGSIRGRVTDPNGSAVPNAQVEVLDVSTGLKSNLTTNGDGEYEAAGLKYGPYKVNVTAQGFKTVSVNVALSSSETVRADVQLEIGEASAIVDVTSEGSVIQTETPTIGGNITARQIIDLPRDSRDIYDFLYLNPNITSGNENAPLKFIGAQSYGAAFSLDGQRSNGGIFSEPTNSQPSLEAIGDLTVLTNNFSAEYAGVANIRVVTKRGTNKYHGSLFYNNKNSALAAWTVQDKVDLSKFVPNPARPDFPKPYFNLNEVGGSFSGPVPGTKRTFFMASYERRWSVTPFRFSATRNLPGQRILNGDFTQLADARKPAVPATVLALLTPDELANNTVLVGATRRFRTIPSRLLNPTTARLIDLYYPKSSLDAPVDALGRLQDFAQNDAERGTRDLVTVRVDHDFTENDKFYGVYNFQNRPSTSGAVAGGAYPAFGFRVNEQKNNTLSLSYTRIFSPKIVNETRGGFNRQKIYRRAPNTLRDFLTSVNFSGSEIDQIGSVIGPTVLDTYGQFELRITNFATLSGGGRSVDRALDQNLVTFGDTLTWSAGSHTLKFGFDTVYNSAIDGFTANRGNPRGRLDYTGGGNANLDAFGRFLIGLPPNDARYNNRLRGALEASNWEHGFFVQDDWRVHPNVTLSLGLRYELITPFVEKNGLAVNFDPDFVDPATGRKGRFVVPSADVLPLIDPAIVGYGVVTAEEMGLGKGLIKTDKNNFAPRLGVAWRVTEKSVFRAGYGIVYPTSAAQGVRDALGSTPFNQGRRRRTAGGFSLGGFPGGITPAGQTPFSGGRLDAASTVPSVNLIDFDLQQPRIQQYNVTFEQEVGWQTGIRVSYLGSRLSGLVGGTDLNLLPPNDTPYGTRNDSGLPCVPGDDCTELPADKARLPFPELGSFLLAYGNYGSGRSHALQFEANRRFARGFSFNVSYTLLDQKGIGFDTGNSSLGGTAYNQFNPEADDARDAFVSRHRFIAYGIVEVPFGKGRAFGKDLNPWAEGVFGGWQLSWNMFAKSGTGFTPFWTCGNCGPVYLGNIASDSLDAVGGFSNYLSYRPRLVSGVNPYGNSNDAYFNTAAFALPTLGADLLDNPDVIKRNSLTGPATWGANLGVRKNFALGERMKLEIGADFNNVFNHPLFSPTNPDFTVNFTQLGTFFVDVDPVTARILPITRVDPNPNFGVLNRSFNDEGIDNRRSVRLRLRFTF